MRRTFAIAAVRVATPEQLLRDGFVVVGGGSVLEVGQGPPPAALPVVDLGDALLAPGFVDLHVHGGGGAQVNCPTQEEVAASVWRMARFHATHGTTAVVPTTVSDSPEALQAAVEGVALVSRGEVVPSTEAGGNGVTEAVEPIGPGPGAPIEPRAAIEPGGPLGPGGPIGPGAVVLGCNLEGPWIARSRAGAQFPDALRLPSVAELDDLVDRGKGTVRIVTLAPELEGAMEVIAAARSAGVVVSIGHTDTDYATARKAFDAGARHATHLFNAMAPIHHRRPGPVAAALVDGRVSLEIIADGVHIHPALISLVATLAPERLVLVTDAIGATGTPPGRHRLGPLEVLVRDGRAVLAGHQETAAGSVLTMDRAVALTVQVAGVPLLTALQAASLHPANVIGEQHKGRLAPGADADMVVLDNDLSLIGTVVGGRVAHDPHGVLAPLEMTASRARLP